MGEQPGAVGGEVDTGEPVRGTEMIKTVAKRALALSAASAGAVVCLYLDGLCCAPWEMHDQIDSGING